MSDGLRSVRMAFLGDHEAQFDKAAIEIADPGRREAKGFALFACAWPHDRAGVSDPVLPLG